MYNKLKYICSLATDTDYVQRRIAQYLNDLLSLGVDGLRIDAAKRELFRVWGTFLTALEQILRHQT